ncbi:MAG: hypothetical protein ABIA93_03700 [Candidatus Woesearchaeota archaeon]
MKQVVVRWDEQAYREFLLLKERASTGQKSKRQPEYSQLLSSIEQAIANLKLNPFFGDLIPRKYLTKRIVRKYGTDELFRIELVGYWRMIYTVLGEETCVIALILEFMSHHDYDKLFEYKKK